MRVQELINNLKGYEDFEIQASFWRCDETKEGYDALETFDFKVNGVADIGHSEKIILLNLELR